MASYPVGSWAYKGLEDATWADREGFQHRRVQFLIASRPNWSVCRS